MADQPQDIHRLLRQALTAQAEMGLGEVLLRSPAVNGAELGAAISAATEAHQVAPAQALQSSESTSMSEQAMIDINEASQFESLTAHCSEINSCMKCSLGESRNKFVYGVGNPTAELMFVGEAPGAEEDRP